MWMMNLPFKIYITYLFIEISLFLFSDVNDEHLLWTLVLKYKIIFFNKKNWLLQNEIKHVNTRLIDYS